MSEEESREARINQAFVRVADTLMDSYDIVDLLVTLVQECTDLLDTEAGGLLIANSAGELELIASSSEDAEFVEVMQLAAGAGPCVDCYTSGVAVSVGNIDKSGEKWPQFRAAALERGFHSIHATPMRLRGAVIGTMNLLSVREGELVARDAALAQALADVAIIGILQERSLRDPNIIIEQLQLALDTRIMVEQAKGVLAYTRSLSMDEAFNALRSYAREHKLTLRTVAENVVNRTLDISVARTAE
jgi:hypothetical protein